MATASDVERDRKALAALSVRAQGALRRLISDVPGPDAIARMAADQVTDLYKLIRDRWWIVAEQYGSMAAALGQTQAAVMLDAIGFQASRLGEPIGIRDADTAFAAVTAALSQDDWLGGILAALDGQVKDANRGAIIDAADAYPEAVVIRVPTGATTCRYCLNAASYTGAEFHSEAQAQGFMRKFHPNCDCSVQIVWGEDTYPENYHPAEYSRQVAQMDREKADRAYDRKLDGWKTPGPKTRQSVRRDASAQAWADRHRIERERDAAKKRLQRATERGDAAEADEAREVLARTKAERDRLNGH